MVFRLLLLAAFAGIAYFAFLKRGRLPINLVLILAVMGCGGALIVFPALSGTLATAFGIGRGADLVAYVFEVGLLFLSLHSATRISELESKLVILTRELALAQAARK